MWGNQTSQEPSEDSVHANGLGEPSGNANQQEDGQKVGLRCTILVTATLNHLCQDGPSDEPHQKAPADSDKEHVNGLHGVRRVVDKCDDEDEKSPSDGVVNGGSRKGGLTDGLAHQLQLGKDTRQHREGCTQNGDVKDEPI